MEEAGALAKHMRQEIQSQNEALLRRVDTRETAKEAWTRVRQLIKTRDKAAVMLTRTWDPRPRPRPRTQVTRSRPRPRPWGIKAKAKAKAKDFGPKAKAKAKAKAKDLGPKAKAKDLRCQNQ